MFDFTCLYVYKYPFLFCPESVTSYFIFIFDFDAFWLNAQSRIGIRP